MSKITDKVEMINNTLIQHGEQNNRIYIMDIDETKDNVKNTIKDIDKLAEDNRYTKIFAKVTEDLKDIFIQNLYIIEAEIPKFYNNSEKCFFMAKYFDKERQINKLSEKTEEVLEISKSKRECLNVKLDDKYEVKLCNEENVEDICSLYSKVFETYPFPIFDPDYIKTMMDENVIYFGVWEDDKLVAVSAAELSKDDGNAEMTDFATDSKHRGQNLSIHLLKRMEEELKVLKIPTAYTIARSISFGMNSTFSKLNYNYAGTVINNTNIGGQIESMNIWFKNIEI